MSTSEHKPTQEAWSDVDQVADASSFARYLDTIRKMDSAGAYKARSLAMLDLKPGGRVLDAGCGTGDDAKKIADLVGQGPGGRVIGLDNSAAMVEEARQRWAAESGVLDFQVGDVHALQFDDDSFDAVRSDRVFQHLAEPVKALGELIRVVRPGGRVSISDPDWGTFVMDGPDNDVMRAYLAHARGQARNSWIGRQLYGMFRRAGLTDLDVATHTVVFLDYDVLDRLGNLDAGFDAALAAGSLTEQDVTDIKAHLRATNDANAFLSSVTVFTVVGTRPAD